MVLWLRRERLRIFHQKRREVLFVTWCNGNWQAAEQHISLAYVYTLWFEILLGTTFIRLRKLSTCYSLFFHCWQHLTWVDQRTCTKKFFFLCCLPLRPATTTAPTTCTFTVPTTRLLSHSNFIHCLVNLFCYHVHESLFFPVFMKKNTYM